MVKKKLKIVQMLFLIAQIKRFKQGQLAQGGGHPLDLPLPG